MRNVPVLALLVFVLVLTGCEAAGHPFEAVQPLTDQAVIYVYRDNPYQGAGVTLDILVDQVSIGHLLNNGYLYKVVPVGHHVVSCKTETESAIAIDAVAGKSYYVEGEVMLGFWVGRPKLTLVPEETGRAAVGGKKYSVPTTQPTQTASAMK